MTDTSIKLYKCISFDMWYWPYIGSEQKLRFATTGELVKGNDKEEFEHRWDSSSPAFQSLESEIRSRYDDLYEKSATLCLGRSPNRECWKQYCGSGGVRYEFEYDPSFVSGVSRSEVDYDDEKTFSLYTFILKQPLDPSVRELFKSQGPMNFYKSKALLEWINGGQAAAYTLKHASNEIPFKKKKEFSFEDEMRFVQLTEPIGPVEIKFPLIDQKSSLENLGLKLIAIATSDEAKVKAELPQHSSIVCPMYFQP